MMKNLNWKCHERDLRCKKKNTKVFYVEPIQPKNVIISKLNIQIIYIFIDKIAFEICIFDSYMVSLFWINLITKFCILHLFPTELL